MVGAGIGLVVAGIAVAVFAPELLPVLGGLVLRALPRLTSAFAAEAEDEVPAVADNPTTLSVVRKMETYLLNPDHPVGSSKAQWFERALGFNRSNMGGLIRQVVFNQNDAAVTAVTQYGVKYNQVISITGANGRVIDVTFAWIRNSDGIVRLITAFPTR